MATGLSPDQVFERRWARAVLNQALGRVREEYAASGKAELFEVLSGFLTDESRFGDYAAVAKRLGMTASAVAVAVHRLRQRYRQFIREAVRPTVTDPAEVDTEVKHLIATLRG